MSNQRPATQRMRRRRVAHRLLPGEGGTASGDGGRRVRVAYVMSRFPHLTETFILREMNELECRAWTVELYPLICQAQARVHAEAVPWLSRVHPPRMSENVAASTSWCLRRPLRCLSIVSKVLRGYWREPRGLARALWLLPRSAAIASALQASAMTHIHAHYATYPALTAWIVHRLTGVTYSVTVHAHDIFITQAMLYTKLASAEFVVAISEYNRQLLLGVDPSWGNKVHVVHCGVHLDAYASPRPRHLQARVNIVCVGSLQEYKGHRVLLGAAAMLRSRGVDFDLRIVGDGPLRTKLETEIARLDLRGHVELLGPLTESEVAQILGVADIYVQPSIVAASGLMEGIPVALMEAMASGVPVVATALSGVPELVEDDVTGLLAPAGDPHALADALERLTTEAALADRLARSGRIRVEQQFDVRRNVAELAGLLRGANACRAAGGLRPDRSRA
jgi:colanic acid/amylovoran biosynthesis glycosyltransferase